MKRGRNRWLKQLSRFFIAFLASAFLVSLLVLLTLRMSLFDEKYIQKQAAKAEYYQKVTKEINQQVENSLLGSNISKGILTNIVTEENVKKDVDHYFFSMYNQRDKYETTADSAIYESTSQTIKNYITENELATSGDSDQVIAKVAEQTVTVYKGYIELPFLIPYGRKMMNYQSKLIIFMLICGILFVLLSLALYSSLKGHMHRLFRYWAYIFSGSALMLMVFPSYVLMNGFFSRLGIQSEAMYDFIQAYLSSFLWMFIYIGIGTLVLGIVCIVVSERNRKKLSIT